MNLQVILATNEPLVTINNKETFPHNFPDILEEGFSSADSNLQPHSYVSSASKGSDVKDQYNGSDVKDQYKGSDVKYQYKGSDVKDQYNGSDVKD